MRIKTLAVALLLPLARLRRGLAPLGRLWAHARLRERLTSAANPTPLDASVVVLGPVEVHGSGRVALGRRLYLYPGLYLETQDAGTIRVGDGVVMSRGVHLVAFAGIDIGADTMIGEYTSIRDANHRTGTSGALREAGHLATPIRIGRGVWIGRGVTILAGAVIGDGAVIGANAVVRGEVPAHSVAVGVPARVIRPAD